MKKIFTLMLVVLLGLSACTQEKSGAEDSDGLKAISEKPLDSKGKAKEKEMTGVATTVAIDPEMDFSKQLTYLSNQFDNSYCQMISLMVDEENYGYNPNLLDEPQVVEKLGEEFVNQLKAKIEANGYTMLSEYCEKNGHKYVTVSDSADYDSVIILLESPEAADGFLELAEVGDLMDFGYAFEPEAEVVDGYHLVRTGYGDAGSIWWSFYKVNPESGETELIEKCNGGSEDLNDPENFNFVYGCDLEFGESS